MRLNGLSYKLIIFSQLITSSFSLWSYNILSGNGYFRYILKISSNNPVECVELNKDSPVVQLFEVDCSDTIFNGIVRMTIDIIEPQLFGITFNTLNGVVNFTNHYQTVCANQELVPFEKWGMVAKDLKIAFDRIWNSGFSKYILELWGKYCDLTISVSGHGYGSCLGQMTAVKIAQLKWWPPSQMFFVGYGTPRCGNEDFAYYVDQSLADKFRVNWYADPIPQYPLTKCDRTGAAQLGRCTDSWYHCCTQILHKKEKVFGIEYTGEKKCKLPEDNACLTGNNPSDHHSYYDTKGTMYNDVTCKGNDF